MTNHLNTTDIWNYVSKTERDGKKVSKCSLCFFELSGHLAGNAKKHLKARHGMALHDEDSVASSKSCVVKSRLRELERTVKTNALAFVFF